MGDTTATPAIAPEVSFQLLLGDDSPLETEGWECQDVVRFSGYRDKSCKRTVGDTTLLYEQTLWTDLKDGSKSSVSAGLFWSGPVLIKGTSTKISVRDNNLNGKLDEGDSLALLGRAPENALRYRCDDQGQWMRTSGDNQGPLSPEDRRAIIDPVSVSYQSAVQASGLYQIAPAQGQKIRDVERPAGGDGRTEANAAQIQLQLGDMSPLLAKEFTCKAYFEIKKLNDGAGYTGFQGSLCKRKGPLTEKVDKDWGQELPESKLILQHLLWVGRDTGQTRPEASSVELSIEIFWSDAVKIPITVRKSGSVQWKEETRVVRVEDHDADGKLNGADRVIVFQKKHFSEADDNLNQADQYRLDEDGQWLKAAGGREAPLTSQEEREFKRIRAVIEENYEAAFKKAGFSI